jgi:spermidine synthase
VTSTAAYAAVALLGGFAMMALQTVLNRIGGLAFGSSHFTFSMVVAVFVLCIALGSFAVSALSRIPPWLIVGSQWALVASLALLYFQLPDATYWAFVLRSHFGDADADFGAFQLAAFGWTLAVLALPVGLSGATLPLLFHHLRREVGDLGAVAGRLYSWNTLGSLLGALLGGYVLLFWLDLHHVHQIALAALSIAAGILTARVLRVRGVLAAAVVVPVLAAIAAFPAWDPTRLSAGLFRERASGPLEIRGADEFFESLPFPEILFHDDDPTATVAVKMLRKGVTRPGLAIVTNGKIDGHLIIDYATMALAALVPALVAENPRRGFVIGYGTGVTAGELASIHSVEEVVVAEISPGVIAAAPYFDVGNLRASKNPRVRIVRGDAYRSLLRAPGRWDVIVSEPSNPWVTGVEMLYSIEFLQAARDRLTPGGVYGQWFHLYETDAPVVELVLRNYAAVFPHVSVWFTKGPDLLLLGMDRADRALDVEALVERFRQPDYTSAFKRAWIGSPAELFAHELLPIGVVHAAELEGDLHTLRHPVLSHRAARAFFRRGNARLPRLAGPASAEVGARHSLLARYLETFDGVELERALGTAARETCNAAQAVPCTTLLAHWMHEHPASRRLANARKALSGAAHTAKIDRVAELFAAAGDRPGTVREVRERTRLYARYYHHAVPFDRGSLETAWARCAPTTECLEARRRAERKLGPLGSP